MKIRIIGLWEIVHTSFWFVPTLLAVAAVLLSFVTLHLDDVLQGQTIAAFGYSRGPEGARTLLSTIASSVITVAGVTFSITIAALTQASSQFGPRLLRNFMRDTGNQLVLGTFIATFLYCLLVLRTIDATGSGQFVPHISVTTGLLLAAASLGVLIYFVHHIASSLQASHVIAAASRELEHVSNRLFPEQLGGEAPEHKAGHIEEDIPVHFEQTACPVGAARSGYIQTIDTNRLMHIATKHNLLLRLQVLPGDFVVQGAHLVLLWPGTRVEGKLSKEIHQACVIGMQRSTTQDVRFALNQVVEVALRALSPSLNDPFTAMTCLDWLGEALSHLAQKTFPSAYRYDKENTLRIMMHSITFLELTDLAFSQIQQAARTNATVTIYLLETIGLVAAHTQNKEWRTALVHHAQLIERESRQALPAPSEQQAVQQRYQEVVNRLLARPEPEV